ncbi:hypothetical protein HRbin33_01507 [bacterium HR33]|nr:hypothetical protein HRbin33_01507 [bacterium HR33]
MRKRVERMGRWVDADQVFEAWTSADLGRMLGARSFQTNPIDRHFLLQGIVRATYRLRSDPEMRRVSVETGMMHLSELSTVVRALRIEFSGAFPRVPSFAWLATALAEEGRVDDAIQVCETAARFGLEDGTKAGGSSDAWRRR